MSWKSGNGFIVTVQKDMDVDFTYYRYTMFGLSHTDSFPQKYQLPQAGVILWVTLLQKIPVSYVTTVVTNYDKIHELEVMLVLRAVASSISPNCSYACVQMKLFAY